MAIGERTPAADLIAWQSRLRDFLFDCVASGPQEEAERVRDAHELLSVAPASARELVPGVPLVAHVEALLSVGAMESAAIALVGDETGFMLSRGASEVCMASVVAPGSAQELTAEGPTIALALLTAHVAALLAQTEEAGARVADARGFGATARLN